MLLHVHKIQFINMFCNVKRGSITSCSNQLWMKPGTLLYDKSLDSMWNYNSFQTSLMHLLFSCLPVNIAGLGSNAASETDGGQFDDGENRTKVLCSGRGGFQLSACQCSLSMVHSVGSLHVFFLFLRFPPAVWRHAGQVAGKLNPCREDWVQRLTATCPEGIVAFKPNNSWINSRPPATQKEKNLFFISLVSWL